MASSRRSARRGAIVALAVMLGGLAGCAQARLEYKSPFAARETLARINANYQDAVYPLYSPHGDVRIDLPDQLPLSGSANTIYDPPRCLLFRVRHGLVGKVAELGSSAEYYWLEIDVEQERRLIYGTWAALEAGEARRMAVSPTQLMNALLWAPLPERLPHGQPPLLVEEVTPQLFGEQREQRLIYTQALGAGWPYVGRVVTLGPPPEHRPTKIEDFAPDGQRVMEARLSDWRPLTVEPSEGEDAAEERAALADVVVPHRYAIRWSLPEGEVAELVLSLQEVKPYPYVPAPCNFPAGWQYERENLDIAPVRPLPRDQESEPS
jgi:hypothetical protein